MFLNVNVLERNLMTKKSASGRRPKLILVSLSQISVKNELADFRAGLRYISRQTPALHSSALPILELFQPIIIAMAGQNRYELIGGTRTFQILMEQSSPARKTWAILLPDSYHESRKIFNAFDGIVSKIIVRPDGKDLAVIAQLLMTDARLRGEVSSLLPVSTDNELANALGMSRATLFRQVDVVKKTVAKHSENIAPSGKKIDLEIDSNES